MDKIALITGVTGQDGSYLSELLLEKKYKVYGMIRRSSVDTTERIKHILNHENFELIEGDVTDASCMHRLISGIRPNEVYNLAAQSHVQTSFDQPILTYNVNAIGSLNILEAIRQTSPTTKYYQASTSELFGDTTIFPQNEDTPFNPASPYGIAKLSAHHLTSLYRRAYGLFACAGILFNHESILKNAPVIIKDGNDLINIVPIEDMFRTDSHKHEGLLDKYCGLSVWDGEKWTKILGGHCYQDCNKSVKLVQTVGSCYEATDDHVTFDQNNKEIKTKDLTIGQSLKKIEYPETEDFLTGNLDLMRFLGFVVAEGSIDNRGHIKLTGCDKELLVRMAECVCGQFGWTYRLETHGPGGFVTSKKDVWQLNIHNDSAFGQWIYQHIYTIRSKEKRVPTFVLNANKMVCQAFFEGYYEGDGRKVGNEQYKYKGWTTSSATLCLGLILILQKISPNQIPKVKCEYRQNNGKSGGRYYYCSLTTDDKFNTKGNCHIKNKAEVIKILKTKSDDGWFYDLTTESKTFAVGPNLIKIHNSPRRGENFVTRKITKYVAMLKKWTEDYDNGGRSYLRPIKDVDVPPLRLGNLDAKRDWSHARDMVRGMWLMLQQSEPDDYVLGSGETHTIREFLEIAFNLINLNYNDYVVVDPKFYRPLDVNLLHSNPSKARQILGWNRIISFNELIEEMVQSDYELPKKDVSYAKTSSS
jgi:GDPmannose 4,6-dehydratase